MNTKNVSVDIVLTQAKRNVERYSQFVKHAPKVLRQSMMLAYQTATDDMLKALDAADVVKPINHPDDPDAVILLDSKGHAL